MALRLVFLFSCTCLHDVDDIVADALAFIDDVHVHRTYGVGIFMVIDINGVSTAELVAIVVNFVFNVERAVDVDICLMLHKCMLHFFH